MVTNSTPIDSFAVSLQYNTAVLNALVSPNTIDYSNNVLGSQAHVSEQCIDDHAIPPGNCVDIDQLGVISLSLVLYGNNTTPMNTTGTLFTVHFKVIGVGFSNLHVFRALLVNATPQLKNPPLPAITVPVITTDAYFTNVDCPRNSGRLCIPPVASLTYSPSKASQGAPVVFNASASHATNLGPPVANVSSYIFDYGDNTLRQTSNSTDHNLPPVPMITHVYKGACNCSATLGVVDTYGIVAYTTIIVTVVHIYKDLTFRGIVVTPQYRVYPGTPVKIDVDVINNSTLPLNGTLTVGVEGRVLTANQNYSLGAFRKEIIISVTWDSTGYVPRVYRIDATIPPASGENNTANNKLSAFVQLITPMTSGLLSLGLLQTGGLGILVLIGIGVGVSLLRRRTRREEEDLSSSP